MRKLFFFLPLIALMISSFSCKQKFEPKTEYSLIPLPYNVREGSQGFVINEKTRIIYSGKDIEVSAFLLQKYIAQLIGYPIEVIAQTEAKNLDNVILLSTLSHEERLGLDGYRLMVDKNKAILSANDDKGVFYGVQTLYQLFDIQKLTEEELQIPPLRIWDEARFSYRGMHLDVCRHFFDVEFIKHYLDLMAYYKFNTFHWHLTEDQGWRIEIKKYPKLTEIGAWRTEEDGSRYGGFYTQEEIKEVIEYAKDLHITIIPEIEMPGHSRAALAAYPGLSCNGNKLEVPSNWGVFEDIYCAGNEKTFEFIQNVLDEVIALFPGEYIHIGGDEAPKSRWENCPKCQSRIQKEGLKNEHELQSYFIKRIDKYLTSKGKKLIGWDEILEGGLAENATVMSWRGMEGGIEAARHGNQVVMTPTSHCYFDYYQADKAFEPKAIGGYLSLKKVYDFEPVPSDLFTEQKALILGAQGNVWTEYIHTPSEVEYMLLPRMLALSEVLWGKKDSKDWPAFQKRLQDHFKLFSKKEISFSKGTYRLTFDLKHDTVKNQNFVEIFSEQYMPIIHYALNGLVPDTSTKVYSSAITLTDSDSLIRAGIFENGKLIHQISEFRIIK
ncbi:MAG: family 20 glycosylhydrolase [Bacteroidota bacterium]